MRNSKKKPLVSVIIPSFNDHASINACLRSVELQTYSNIEIIVIDDASNPPLRPDYLDFRNVSIIRNTQNMGVSYCRNLGVKKSHGELICFLDSDDAFLPRKIETQVREWEKLGRKRLVIIGSGVNLKNSSNELTGTRTPRSSNNLSDFYSGIWFFPGSAILIDRRAFELSGFFDEKLRRLEDFDFAIRFATAGGEFISIDEILCEVMRSRRAKTEHIHAAFSKILSKHFSDAPDLRCKVRLVAYLLLEIGAQYYFERKYFFAAPLLFLSWLLKPRMQASLNKWWT